MGDEGTQTTLVKYIIYAKMYVEGIVEKHDIIGAIFGQLDGLLPSNMDLQELQRIGKIDRISVKVGHKEGKTYANIEIPCNLSKLEVAILAAALETIDRVGPSRAETVISKIEDIRKAKREAIVRRAAEILKKWDDLVAPESADILKKVEEETRKSRIILYGQDKLPAGPGVLTNDEIIIVEGRSDVINLMKHGFDNVIAVEGTRIPQTIIDLSKKKITTAFVDGDRSGLLILKELLQVADIDYIARAPEGKEVEYLSLKEIKKALAKRLPADIFRLNMERALELLESSDKKVNDTKKVEEKSEVKEHTDKNSNLEELDLEIRKSLAINMRKLLGTDRYIIMDKRGQKILDTGKLRTLRDKIKGLNLGDNGAVLLVDSPIEQWIIDVAEENGIKIVIGKSIGSLSRVSDKVKISTIDNIL